MKPFGDLECLVMLVVEKHCGDVNQSFSYR